MGIQVEGHSAGYVAGVTEGGRLQTEAQTNLRGFYVSRDEQRLFNAVFVDASAAAGNYVAYLKNTSTSRILIIDLIRVEAANAALWKVVTATGTATGGTTVTAVNMNRQSGIAPEATMLADNVGGFTAGSALIAIDRHPDNSSSTIPFDDTLILGPQNAIAIEYDTGSTGAAGAVIRFYYEDL